MFIDAFPDDTQKLIGTALKEKGIDVPDGEVPETCADLFASILQNCVSKPRNQKEKPSATPAIRRNAKRPLPPEPLYECFGSAVEGFPIEAFLNSDPIDSLTDYLIRDAVTFWGRINAEQDRKAAPDRDTEAYQSIIAFIGVIKDYLEFLRDNSVRPDAFPDDFHLICSDGDVADKANHYRKSAWDLFKAANTAVEAEYKKTEKERTDTIHAGEYSLFTK